MHVHIVIIEVDFSRLDDFVMIVLLLNKTDMLTCFRSSVY